MSRTRKLWSVEEAGAWHDRQPWLVGCNFIPSTAINQLEMWQGATFDPETIDRELRWAGDIGYNAVRVFLHDLLWQQDREGFLQRAGRFLEIANRHRIAVMPVLFDGVWDPFPHPGPQRAPRPHVHNSGWVQSPGVTILSSPSRHDELQDYVEGTIEHFRDDPRVLAWDLFNEPDNPNIAYGDRETPDKSQHAAALLAKAYRWARDAGPTQPITCGVWRGSWGDLGQAREIERLALTESDVISFHSYLGPEDVLARIRELGRLGRPILLTEYMSRATGSTFEAILPILRGEKIGAFNWGLVSGKTQTIYPWDSWVRPYTGEPETWFHDVLRPDGTPHRAEEIGLIRRLTGRQ